MAKTNAEKQAEFKKRMKDKGFIQRVIWVSKDTPAPDLTPVTPAVQTDGEQWENETRELERKERIKAARVASRDSERKKHYERGYVEAAITAAGFFLQGNRYSPDIAEMLLSSMNIDRERAAAGQDDFQLSKLDKAGVWKEK